MIKIEDYKSKNQEGWILRDPDEKIIGTITKQFGKWTASFNPTNTTVEFEVTHEENAFMAGMLELSKLNLEYIKMLSCMGKEMLIIAEGMNTNE